MKVVVFDIETDGFDPSKIHCLTGAIKHEGRWLMKSTASYDDMRKMCREADVLVGHNITFFDIPVMEKLLDIKITSKIQDTLALSSYLYPELIKQGLEDWGERLGTKKKEIKDWEGLTTEEYIERCESDVKINTKLYDKILKDLDNLYGTLEASQGVQDYLQFKYNTVRLQEVSRWRLDVKKAEEGLEMLLEKAAELDAIVASAMPKVKKYGTKKLPKVYHKKDGTKSAAAIKYEELRDELGLTGMPKEIQYIRSYEDPNPQSSTQIKNWLFDLGWEPETFNYVREDRGFRKVPQIRVEKGGEKVLCDSVLKLAEKVPELNSMRKVTVIRHRASILKGFLKDQKGGYVCARMAGFTNTLRLRHKELVNLPGVFKEYGDLVRGCLIASDDDHELCGSDMSSLEDRTKQHFMWEHDPEFVKQMLAPDFDPHLDLAVTASMLTEDQARAHKMYSSIPGLKDKGKEEEAEEVVQELAEMGYENPSDADFSSIRKVAKGANYACTYKVGAATLSRATGLSEKDAGALIESYWVRNWALKAVEESLDTKPCLGTKWLKNPINGFWYHLKADKDKFSTLNQGTGTYAFDMWIKEVLSKREQMTGQFHDEIIINVSKGHRDRCTKFLKSCVQKVNEKLKLNRDLDIDVQFGESYKDIH